MGKNKSLKSDTYLHLMRETLFEETIPALSPQSYLQEPLAFHLLMCFFLLLFDLIQWKWQCVCKERFRL